MRDELPMRAKSRYGLFLGVGFAVVLGVWLFREPLRNRITQSATLANPAPPPELVEEFIEASPDRATAILAAWNTGKIIHRQVAVREIARSFLPGQSLPAKLESIVLTGALDADMNVREAALGILRDRDHPALAALAAAQLRDCDPEVRLLGLNHLKRVQASIGVPTIIPLLDEDDPLIVATGLRLLENWSGGNFGVKLSETMSRENEKTGLKEFPEASREKARAGAVRARAWWADHQAEFPVVRLEVPREALTARRPVPAGDFSARALDGQRVRLRDFRGQVVLLNFWTTWCPACVSEMPELIVLQKRHAGRLVVLGVSLDFVPDSHGHLGGHAAVEEPAPHAEPHDARGRDSTARQKVRAQVARTVKARGINYTVLLDEDNEIGGRFNGGELPTTVIVDAQGNVRRRFVGARPLAVFEAMIAEAGQPAQVAMGPLQPRTR
jgi:thiol-disulfide isomerase/thioredoxin